MEAGVEAVRAALAEASIEVEVAPGGEIALDALPTLSREDLAALPLARTAAISSWSSITAAGPLDLEQRIFELVASGLTPILARTPSEAATSRTIRVGWPGPSRAARSSR